MPDDALESVLRLVAEGRLTAEEAGPILDALELDAKLRTTNDLDARPASPPRLPLAAPAGPSASRSPRVAARSSTCASRSPSAGRPSAGCPACPRRPRERIREAIEAGITGPILDVDEGTGDGVRIVIE